MPIKIAITKESQPYEARVAATPDTVKTLCELGCKVSIEKTAGLKAGFADSSYKSFGAEIASSAQNAVQDADIILQVQINEDTNLYDLKESTILIGLANPSDNISLIKSLLLKKINIFAMELMPRISRAQSMDVLSSQANLAGYKSIIDAAACFNRAFPMMMTAAGTIAPAKVLIMGAGVAGLQAIATAKRLGAVVSATDVRPAAKEQVQSLGAKFIAVENDEFKAY